MITLGPTVIKVTEELIFFYRFNEPCFSSILLYAPANVSSNIKYDECN